MTFPKRTICVATLLVMAMSLLAESSDSWIDRQVTGRFQMRSEVPIRQSKVLSNFMHSLRQHESDISETLGLRRNQKPIVINVFQSRLGYQDFVTRIDPGEKERRALFIQSETHGSVYAYLHADVMTDLRHETTHAILHSSLPFVPLWLDEGLAEYFEVAREKRVSGNPHLRRTKLDARLILTWRPNLTKLEAVRDQSAMTARNYRESWAWVHFLLHGPDAANSMITRYLASIEAHDPPGPLSAQLKRVWSKPERQLTSHIKSWK